MSTVIRLTSMPQDTQFVPLGVIGYCLTRSDFLAPVFAELKLLVKKVDYDPAAKVLDVLVSIMAGCRAIAQVNTRLCPDQALASAWGRERFAEQSTLSRTLDAFGEDEIAQLRQGSEVLFRRESHTLRHDSARGWLWLDIDLTPLPVSAQAEGSTKGKIGGEKTVMGASWCASTPHNTRRRCSLACIRASNTAVQPTSPRSRRSTGFCCSMSHANSARFCAQIPALAATTTSTMP